MSSIDESRIEKNCLVCGLYKQFPKIHSPILKPVGAENPKYIVVGEQPTVSDDRNGSLFSGRSSQKFKRMLKELGFNLDEILFTSGLRCRPQVKASKREITLCGDFVKKLIDEKEPDGVILLGDIAVRAVFPNATIKAFDIMRTRGSRVPYTTPSGKIIPCVVTYGIIHFEKSQDEEEMEVWMDDIVSVSSDIPLFKCPPPVIRKCLKLEDLKDLSKRLKEEKMVAFDFETTALKPFKKDGNEPSLYSVSFAFEDGEVFAVPLNNYFPSQLQKAVEEMVREFFYSLNPNQQKIGFNTKFDMLWGIVKTGGGLEKEPMGKYEDVMLLTWILDERPWLTGLKVSAWRYLGVDDWDIDVSNVSKFSLNTVLEYNAYDSHYTLQLYKYFWDRIKDDETTVRLYRELLLPSSLQFLKVEMRGVPIDGEMRGKFYTEYDKKLRDWERKLKELAGSIRFNPNSPKDLQDYFFKEKKYKPVRRTKKGHSTDKGTLSVLVENYDDPVARGVLEYKKIEKLQSTYVGGLGKHIYDDQRIHGSYNLTGTITGRTSSDDPNMQNFPKRESKEVRKMLVAPDGYKLCSFDYGQIEARLFAIMTGDEKYIDDLYNGYDIHLEKSKWIYCDNLGESEEVAKQMRRDVKSVVFGSFYGGGKYTVAKTLDIPVELADEFIKSIFERYPGVKKWQKELKDRYNERGYITSLYGRVRRAPVKYNQLLNFPMQSTASDMTLTAMLHLGKKYEVAMMIHDDIGIFIPDNDKLESEVRYIVDAMLVLPWIFLSKSSETRSYAPLQVECEAGDNLGDQKPVITLDSVEMGYTTLEKSLNRAEEIVREMGNSLW